jgi:hypothetical protein
VVGVTHAGGLAAQQPFSFWHDVGSQMHEPPEHRSPTPQAAPGPQVQTPEGEQVSASVATHGAQALPMAPQELGEKAVHTFPVQQPVGHVLALHTQAPPEQAWPETQGAEVPQRHSPALEQLSAAVESHAAQAVPATPHVANADVVQFAPAQHPAAQLVGVQPVHTPPSSQFWMAGQAEHAEPFPPHIPLTFPGSHVLPEQHPLGQEVPLQTHAPLTHSCPRTHAGPDPQVQRPAPEQPSASIPQVWQRVPAVPQTAADGTSHTRPWQHPVGHEPGVQTHVPLTHA